VWTRGFAAFWTALVLALSSSARPAEAWQFPCVTYPAFNNVSVINSIAQHSGGHAPVLAVDVATSHSDGGFFSAISAKVWFYSAQKPNHDYLLLLSEFTLGQNSGGINPPVEPVTIKVGAFATTIQPGSFEGDGLGPYHFQGVIEGVDLEVLIKPTGDKRFALDARAYGINLSETEIPVTVRLSVGNNSGTTYLWEAPPGPR
jgi:hypothetical protein